MQKPLSLIRSHLFIFVFQYFGRWIEKDIASIYMSVLTVFSLRALQLGFPGGTGGKEPTCQCRRHKKCRFDLWFESIEEMAAHSSILAWRIPCVEELGGL